MILSRKPKDNNSFNSKVDQNDLNKSLLDVIVNGASVDAAKQLINQGADVNSSFSETVTGGFDTKNNAEWSLLDVAVRYNNLPLIELLLEEGADPNSGRWYPVRYKYDMSAGFDLWEQDPYISRERIFYCTLSETIWNTKNFETLKLLLKYGANPNYTYRHYIVQPPEEHPRYVPMLYAYKDYSALTDAILFSDDARVVEELLKAGANPNEKYMYKKEAGLEFTEYEIPVLDIAVVKNKKQAVELLLKMGGILKRIVLCAYRCK